MSDDAMEIRVGLEQSIEAVLDALNPGWVERRGIAYLTPKSNKDLGSFTVQLRGGKMPRGSFYRFSQAVGGGSVELVSYLLTGRKDAYREAFAWSREFLGMERRNELTPAEKAEFAKRRERQEADRAAQRAAAAAKEAERREERRETSEPVWKGSVKLSGSPGDIYFQYRGLPPVAEWEWDPDHILRFHPSVPYEINPRLGRFPAIIGKAVDAYGVAMGLKIICLNPDGKGKSRIIEDAGCEPKPTMGNVGGCAVRLGGEGESIGVGEGIETCLSAWFLNGCHKPVWACLSTSGMVGFEIPAFVKRLEIFPDGDKAKMQSRPDGSFTITDRPGMAAARGLEVEAGPILGRENVSIAPEPGLKMDYNDLYRKMKAKGML